MLFLLTNICDVYYNVVVLQYDTYFIIFGGKYGEMDYILRGRMLDDKALLREEGANPSWNDQLGPPVLQVFTITTESCTEYLESPYFFESSLQRRCFESGYRFRRENR